MNSTAGYTKVRLEEELSVLRVSAGQVGKASKDDPLEKAKDRNPPHPTLTIGTETQSEKQSLLGTSPSCRPDAHHTSQTPSH